jgi:hypothetical protein
VPDAVVPQVGAPADDEQRAELDHGVAERERGLEDSALRALCRAVRCEPIGEGRGGWASEVTITLRDGRVLTRACDDFPGTPSMPLDDDALAAKYRRCATGFEPAERLLGQLMDIARMPDVRALALS